MTDTDPISQPLEAILPALRDVSLSATALADAAIARHETHGDTLEAYIAFDADGARRAAAKADERLSMGDPAPLCGIPVSLKDLYGLDGFETFAGSPKPLPEKWTAEGPVVAGLKRDGAVIAGKTHMVEFAFGGIGSNPHWPAPRNPWGGRDAKARRVSGGSSSGAGVSLWEGSALVAFGSDTAGSVRIPACWTGTVGLKTTKHRWSTDGLVPLSTSLDTPGILTITAADAAIAFAGIDPGTSTLALDFLNELRTRTLKGARIGVYRPFFDGCSPGIAEAVEAALAMLEKAGAVIADIDLAPVAEAMEIFKRGGLAAPEFAALINGEFEDWKDSLDPNVRARFERIEAIPATDYINRRNRLLDLAADMDEALAGCDAVAGPTVPIAPPTLDEIAKPEDYFGKNLLALRNTATVNLLDLCAVSLPCGKDALGLPAGLQLIGRNGADVEMLALAVACEAVLGTAAEMLGTPPLLR
jgi:aspartyl-tRNA(Asn)/glutamyl-tRNA(Gln) amidotransferase subunit A